MQSDKAKFKKEFMARLINFTVSVIQFGDKTRKSNKFLWSLIDQLIRSAGSIGANVVEAKAASSKRDYIKYFEIALKSANETIYWLLVLEKIVDDELKQETIRLLDEVKEISKVLGSSVLTLKNKK